MTHHVEPVRTQYREILRFVRRRVRSTADAEDITQEVFANAAESLARSASSAPPTLAWLYTVARRRIVDEARRQGREPSLELVADREAPNDTYGGQVAGALSSSLGSMPGAQRRVVVMRLLEGRSFADIATKVGATEDACRMRFMRGLEHLRTEFEKEGLTP